MVFHMKTTLVIDDDDQSMLLEDQHGNSIKMSSDGIALDAVGDIKITATGDVSIQGTNVSHSAQADFSASGTKKASLESTADVVVKGSFVKIN